MKRALFLIVVLFASTAFGQKAMTVAGWSGCYQQIIVLDNNKPRCFERIETQESGTGKPGTGIFGDWQERTVPLTNKEIREKWQGDEDFRTGKRAYPKTGAGPAQTLIISPVSKKEVRRCLGDKIYEKLEKDNKAVASGRYNLTKNPNWDY